MERPLVTVVLPTYNRSFCIKRAISSVVLQRKINWELIIIDDGSVDDTLQTIKPFLSNPKIFYFYTSHSGVSFARNKGVEKARGQWISFLDSDDEWKKDKLFLQYDALKKSNLVWNQTQEIWIRDGIFVNQPKHTFKKSGDIFKNSLYRCLVTPSSVMIEKNIFEQVGGFDTSFFTCEDYELWLRLSSQFKIGLLEEKLLIRYAGHADQLSVKYPFMDRFRIRAMDKIFRAGVLDKIQSEQCLTVLKQKVKIYLQGCKKHQNMQEKKMYERKYKDYL